MAGPRDFRRAGGLGPKQGHRGTRSRRAGLDKRAQIGANLAEWSYGEWEGLIPPQIHKKTPGWILFRDGAPGGGTAEQVGARVARLIARLRSVDGNVALFVHSQLFRVFAARCIGLPPEQGCHFRLDTATLSTLSYYRETPAVNCGNAMLP